MMNAAPKWNRVSDAEMVRRLERPAGKIHVVLDTDTYNEIDDQFALSYMVRSVEKLEVKAIYAAPFSNHHSTGPADGMERSYQEILKVLTLLEAEELKEVTYRGSTGYLPNEDEPVISDAAKDLAERAMQYSAGNPLYVISIGAITNIASAILQTDRPHSGGMAGGTCAGLAGHGGVQHGAGHCGRQDRLWLRRSPGAASLHGRGLGIRHHGAGAGISS